MTIKIVLFCVLSHQLIAQNNCERKNSESVLNGLEPLGVKPLKIRSKYTLKFSYYFLGRRIFSWMRTKYCQNPCFAGTAQITSSASLLSWNHGNVLICKTVRMTTESIGQKGEKHALWLYTKRSLTLYTVFIDLTLYVHWPRMSITPIILINT